MTLRYFEAANGAGTLIGSHVYRGAAGARDKGLWVQFDVQLDMGIVQAARFLALACPHIIAVCSWITQAAERSPARAALPESVKELSERFAVPIEKRGKLLMVEDAWLAALKGAPALELSVC